MYEMGGLNLKEFLSTFFVRQINSEISTVFRLCFLVFVPGTWLFGTSSPSANIPRADVEPIIRPDLLPSVMVNPSKLEVLLLK